MYRIVYALVSTTMISRAFTIDNAATNWFFLCRLNWLDFWSVDYHNPYHQHFIGLCWVFGILYLKFSKVPYSCIQIHLYNPCHTDTQVVVPKPSRVRLRLVPNIDYSKRTFQCSKVGQFHVNVSNKMSTGLWGNNQCIVNYIL